MGTWLMVILIGWFSNRRQGNSRERKWGRVYKEHLGEFQVSIVCSNDNRASQFLPLSPSQILRFSAPSLLWNKGVEALGSREDSLGRFLGGKV